MMLINTLSQYTKFAFYGAQVVAYGAHTAIEHLTGRNAEGFVVSKLDYNPREIDGIPVLTLDKINADTLVIIAVTEILHDEIADVLADNGYTHIFKLTAHEEHLLMSQYYASLGLFPQATESHGEGRPALTLLTACNHLDKQLRHTLELKPWEIAIQAGAELTDLRLCEQLDNIGDNISKKNKQYCEATAIYWAWKNAQYPWVGIGHYRRRLLVTPNMLCEEVDAILPLPYICCPDVRAQLRRFVDETAVEAMLEAIRALYPEHSEIYERCLNAKHHYAYNLFAVRHSVFTKYCEWVFSITDYIEKLEIQSFMDTRTMSYIVEMLTSMYYIANTNGLRIKHVEKAIFT